jgi:molybdenum cofactor sulfurtransferase
MSNVLTAPSYLSGYLNPMAMDIAIPPHILDAVHATNDPVELPARAPSAKSSPRKVSSRSRFPRSRSARSSLGDVSSVDSESEQEHGYQTDFTSIPSDASPDDMQPDDVEDFRDREYPQLKGKTYLDHGGTTVRRQVEKFAGIEDMLTWICSYMRDLS